MKSATQQPRIARSLDSSNDHEAQDPATRLRQRLAQKRAEQALPRRRGWLGTGNRWMAMDGEGCACGCGQPVHAGRR